MLPTIAIILLVLVLVLSLSKNAIKSSKTNNLLTMTMNLLFIISLVLLGIDQLTRDAKKESMHLSQEHQSKNNSKTNELIVLTMTGCGYCTKLKSEVLPKLKNISNLKVTVIGDKHSDFKKLSKEYGTGGYPHAHMNGENIVGYMPADKYVEKVKSLM